jgi:hypothetical protein
MSNIAFQFNVVALANSSYVPKKKPAKTFLVLPARWYTADISIPLF